MNDGIAILVEARKNNELHLLKYLNISIPMSFKTFIILSLCLFLSACQTTGGSKRSAERVGEVIGGVAGAIIGYNEIGKGLGKLGGMMIGQAVGKVVGGTAGAAVDDHNRAPYSAETVSSLESAIRMALKAETGALIKWRSPDRPDHYHGIISPLSDNFRSGSQTCRKVRADIYNGNDLNKGVEVYCKNYGSDVWHVDLVPSA